MKAAFLRKLTSGFTIVGLAVMLNVTSIACSPASAKVPAPPAAPQEEGYTFLLKQNDEGKYDKHGWNHYGPGYFDIDRATGVLTSHGGMGLFWFSEKMFGDYILELDFLVDKHDTNSGIFFRVPYVPVSNQYIYDSFEIQIYDAVENKNPVMHEGAAPPTGDPMKHATGAIYDAKPPEKLASFGPGKWNHYKITFQGLNVTVELNGETVNQWQLQPSGKVATCWPKGYIGLQNHDETSSVHFANIRVKELATAPQE